MELSLKDSSSLLKEDHRKQIVSLTQNTATALNNYVLKTQQLKILSLTVVE